MGPHLLILLISEVIGHLVVAPHHVLDGGLPDGPGTLPVGVKTAVGYGASSTPPEEGCHLIGENKGLRVLLIT